MPATPGEEGSRLPGVRGLDQGVPLRRPRKLDGRLQAADRLQLAHADGSTGGAEEARAQGAEVIVVKVTDPGGNGIYFVEDIDGDDLSIGPVCVWNFRIKRTVFRLEGPKRRPKKIGEVIGPADDPQALAEAVVKTDREWEEWLSAESHRECLRDRGWVLDLTEGN